MKILNSTVKKYHFITSKTPILKRYSYEPFLFNEDAFFEIPGDEEKIFFYIINNEEDAISGRFNLSIKSKKGFSPSRAPFGSIEFDKEVSLSCLDEFIKFIIRSASVKGVQEIHIRSYPSCYAPENEAHLVHLFFLNRFEVTSIDLNQHLDVTSQQLKEKVSSAEKKRINKCLRSGFVFALEEKYELEEVYNLIKRNREFKGYPLSMSLKELDHVMNLLRDRYKVFTIRTGGELVAAAVSIFVNKAIIYNFYHGHDPDYNQFSPVTMLLEGIYDFAHDNHYTIIDLGTSTLASKVNEGLFRFKRNMGATTTLKYTFRLTLQ